MALTAVTTITIGGQTIALPGAYSTLDTTAAQVPGFATGKVLAIVADTVGGEPLKLLSFTSLTAVRQNFLFSSLATNLKNNAAMMARLAYNASDDDRINGTFERIVFVKPGRDEAATGVLVGTAGDLADLEAKDWGLHTNQFGYQVGAGTLGGVSMQIVGGTIITQSGDNIGADPVMQVRYDGQADKMWITVEPDATVKWKLSYEHDEVGLEGTEIVAGWTAGIATIVSTDTSDIANVTIYGIFGGAAVAQMIALDGTTPVDTTQQFTKVTGVRVHGMTIGTVTVEDSVALTIATFAPTVADITAPPDYLQAVSSSVSDVGLPVQIAGKSDTGVDLAETIVLNGTTPVQTANQYAKFLTVKIIGTTVGTVTMQDTVPSTLVTLAPGTDPSAGLDNTKGLYVFDPALETVGTVDYTMTTAKDVVLRGTNSSGAVAAEYISAGSGTTTTVWSSIEHMELGAVPGGDAVTLEADWIIFGDVTMLELESTVELQNGATVVVINGARKTSELDALTGVDVKGSLTDVYSQAQDVIDFIDSGIVMSAVRKSGATGLPALTPSTVLLTGGADNPATASDIAAAFEILKQDTGIRYVVPAFTDQATHLLTKEHVNNRALPTSKAECRGWVPLDPTTATKAAIKELTVALNNERIGAVVQRKSYYDDDGILQAGDSLSFALTMAGMQASAVVGEPLTWKFMSAIGVTQDGAWTPEQDGDELVRSGLTMAERIRGRGWRIIRSVSSYQKRTDRIRTEMSSMESADESARDLRTFMEEQLTGRRNLLVTDDSVKNMVEGRLSDQVTQGIITAWRRVSVQIIGDLIIIDYEVAPVEPINFIQLQAHVFTVVQTAEAA
jgi:hypothetical protein